MTIVAEADAQHHHVKERRFGQDDAALAVVVADMEVQFVHPRDQALALQQRLVAAAVGIGRHLSQQTPLFAVQSIQQQRDARPGAAVGCIQNVCRQFAHLAWRERTCAPAPSSLLRNGVDCRQGNTDLSMTATQQPGPRAQKPG
ncbi:hypothetical protein D9M71_702300 [compost metagenome]